MSLMLRTEFVVWRARLLGGFLAARGVGLRMRLAKLSTMDHVVATVELQNM